MTSLAARETLQDRSPAAGRPPAGTTVAIHTHGCKLNQSDSQELARQFEAAGYLIVDATGAADVVVLNTCTVTATADAKARQFLRKINRSNPGAVRVATGCYAQRDPAALGAVDGVSLVLNNTRKPGLVDAVTGFVGRKTPSAAMARTPDSPAKAKGGVKRARAMIKIQEGCDQVCAYCIVPKVRGRERSIPPEVIVAQIAERCAEGYREVVLTGTQLGSYGFDLQEAWPGAGLPGLPGLLWRVLDETTVDRLRVSSLQAHEITPELLKLWKSPRMCPHFHIPLQSGSDAVLRAMRRRYDTARFASAVELVRRRVDGAAITTDIIVGFPGEGGPEFEEGFGLASAMAFSDIHAFPYSARPGTSAAYFRGVVDDEIKRERMSRMLELAADSHRRFREDQVGTVRGVLWEPQPTGPEASWWTGLTDNYIKVRAESGRDLGNAITRARLTGYAADLVSAQVV